RWTSSAVSDAAPTETSALSLHDALPICFGSFGGVLGWTSANEYERAVAESRARLEPVLASLDSRQIDRVPSGDAAAQVGRRLYLDRKSTRLNSSHVKTSYAVFCLKKRK